MRIRRLISLVLLVSFIFLSYSGLMLFLSPQGRVAYWSNWAMLGLTKDQYSAVHMVFMVLFLTVGIWHTVLNWKPIVHYLRNRAKRVRVLTPESTVALVLCLFFFVGTLTGIPPFRQFLDANEAIKAHWERESGSPPWGHAEESRLDRFCLRMADFERIERQRDVTIDCSEAVIALEEAGIIVEDQSQRLVDIAEMNSTTPKAIAEIVVGVADFGEAVETPGGREGEFVRPYSGMGRITMREYAERYDADLDRILSLLAERGIELDPDGRLREEADRLGMDPGQIFDLLNESAGGGGGRGR